MGRVDGTALYCLTSHKNLVSRNYLPYFVEGDTDPLSRLPGYTRREGSHFWQN